MQGTQAENRDESANLLFTSIACDQHGSARSTVSVNFRARCGAEVGGIRVAEPCCCATDVWTVRPQAPRPAPPALPGPSPPPQVLPHAALPDRRLVRASRLAPLRRRTREWAPALGPASDSTMYS
jgi:hypothetical protein